jgi:hypothetical protein
LIKIRAKSTTISGAIESRMILYICPEFEAKGIDCRQIEIKNCLSINNKTIIKIPTPIIKIFLPDFFLGFCDLLISEDWVASAG